MAQPPPPPPPSDGAASSSSSKSTLPAKPPPRPVPRALAPLQYMGIPRSVLTWRPRLPGRNWLIFWTLTGTLSYLYWDDRRQCKRIRKEYEDRVKYLGEQTLDNSLDYGRKVLVLGAKGPEDDDWDRGLRYFRKYVKPILVAAAVDWETVAGKQHGALARAIEARVHDRRRLEARGPQPPEPDLPPTILTPEQKLQRELEGGVLVVGRPAFKEYMAGLKRGWSGHIPAQPPREGEEEERLVKILEQEEDRAFDEPPKRQEMASEGVVSSPDADNLRADEDLGEEDEVERRIRMLAAEADGDDAAPPSRLSSSSSQRSSLFAPFSALRRAPAPAPPSPAASSRSTTEPTLIPPPDVLPAQPPLLYVPYATQIGFRTWPRRIVGFFRQRDKVREGGETAIRLVLGGRRDFEFPPDQRDEGPWVPETEEQGEREGGREAEDRTTGAPTHSDLDWGLDSERFYKPSFFKLPKYLDDAKARFYAELPEKLATARALARGEREPTKEEKNYPPPTESELRAQRIKKELSWRGEKEGFDIVKPSKPVQWDDRFRSRFAVFTDPDLEKEKEEREKWLAIRREKERRAEGVEE